MALAIRNWGKFQHFHRRRPPWIKLHHELLDDRKFKRLPIVSQALLPQLWLYASEFDDGVISEEDSQIAHRLRWAPDEYERGLAPLLAFGFCHYVASEARQLAFVAFEGHESQVKGQGQVIDSSDESHEGQQKPPQSQSQSQSESYKKRNRGGGKIAFPDGWTFETLTEGEREQASTRGLDPQATFEEFESHWRMRDQRFNNWPQAWRNWCLKAARIRNDGRNSNGHNGRADRARQLEPGRKSYVDRAREGFDRFLADRSSDVHGANGNGMAPAGNIAIFGRSKRGAINSRNDASSVNGSGDHHVPEGDDNDHAVGITKPIDF